MSARRVAMLGFGHVAELGHLPAWREREDFRIVAVADVAPERRRRAADLLPGARIYADPAALLAGERVDVVDIATPPALHAPLIVVAARAGCHVLCEKPLAVSTEDLAPAAEAASEAGVVLFTVHNWKHSEQFRYAAAVVADGKIGAVRTIRLETVRNGRAVAAGPEWRGDVRLAGGGILVDHGWHALYLLTGLAREMPSSIRAAVDRVGNSASSVEDTARCWIDFPSVSAEVHLTWAGAERRTRWEIEGTRGSLLLEDDRGEFSNGKGREDFVFGTSLSIGSHHPDWFGAVIDDFVGELCDPARRGKNLTEATLCLLLTDLAYASASSGGEPRPIHSACNGHGRPTGPRAAKRARRAGSPPPGALTLEQSVEKVASTVESSFPRKRESSLFVPLLDPRFRGGDR